jgi:hypothetical protein
MNLPRDTFHVLKVREHEPELLLEISTEFHEYKCSAKYGNYRK